MTITHLQTTLDPSRLERLRPQGDKLIARCPACAEHGGDRGGGHLVLFPDGRFACAACPGDTEHRKRIFALTGLTGDRQRDPSEDREWRARRERERALTSSRQKLRSSAKKRRKEIIAQHAWEFADVWDDSPQRPDGPRVERDPRHFLASLFSPEALLWTGTVRQSGPGHARRWRTCAEWLEEPDPEPGPEDGEGKGSSPGSIGPMLTPAVWQPGTVSRRAEAVLGSPYTVLDFDGFDGLKPVTAAEKQAHLRASLALIRWLREDLHWKLAAILWTGGKSLHAWFRTPPPEVLATLRESAAELGIDAGLIGRAEHPCRLPGWRHQGTGKCSRVWWLGK